MEKFIQGTSDNSSLYSRFVQRNKKIKLYKVGGTILLFILMIIIIIRNKRLNSIWLQNYFIYISYYHLGNGNHETHEDLEMTNNAMNDHIDVWLHACPSCWSTVFQMTFRVWGSRKIIILRASSPGPSLFFLGVFVTQEPFIWNTGSALMISDHKQRIKLPLGLAHVSFDVNVVGKN